MPYTHNAGAALRSPGVVCRALPRSNWFAAHIVTTGLALSLLSLSLSSGQAPAARVLMQVARQYGSASTGTSSTHTKPFDPDAPDKSWNRSTGSRIGTSRGSAAGTYNPDRIKHFWQHYHPDTREPKTKPLDREK